MKLNEITGRMWASQGDNPDASQEDREANARERLRQDSQSRTIPLKSSSTDIIEVAKAYKKNLKIILDKKLYFFRSSKFQNDGKLEAIDGEDILWKQVPKRMIERHSESGSNYLMWAVDQNFKGFPKRSMSYFASQQGAHSRRFIGQNMLIIPADNIDKFGWMPHDFNENDRATDFHKNLRAVKSLWNQVSRLVDKRQTSLMKHVDTEIFLPRKISTDPEDGIQSSRKFLLVIDALNELLDREIEFRKWATGEGVRDKPIELSAVDERFLDDLKIFKDEMREHGMETLEDTMKLITPENMDAKLYTSLADVKKSSQYSDPDELWFEGSYLGIAWYGETDSVPALKALYDALG